MLSLLSSLLAALLLLRRPEQKQSVSEFVFAVVFVLFELVLVFGSVSVLACVLRAQEHELEQERADHSG